MMARLLSVLVILATAYSIFWVVKQFELPKPIDFLVKLFFGIIILTALVNLLP